MHTLLLSQLLCVIIKTIYNNCREDIKYKINQQYKDFYTADIADKELTLSGWLDLNVNKKALEVSERKHHNLVGSFFNNKETQSGELWIRLSFPHIPEDVLKRLNQSKPIASDIDKRVQEISDMILDKLLK